MMEMSTFIGMMTFVLMVLIILVGKVSWRRDIWSIPTKIQWLDNPLVDKASSAWHKVISNGVNSLQTLTALTSLVLPPSLPLLLEFPTPKLLLRFCIILLNNSIINSILNLYTSIMKILKSLQKNWYKIPFRSNDGSPTRDLSL